jgi:redox-sensitive bicupin YhaK (pirin superfamily)
MIDELIPGPEHDLGGFTVRRLLPHRARRAVGPFVFFDHMGPAGFPAGSGISVRPHPHIHLATVTYLFEGAIRHRDSLGSDQRIEPGAINWMTAGRGIVHSERAPDDFLARGGRLHGIQLWVALPAEHEDTEPSFTHHPASSFPVFEREGARCRLLLGSALGRESPVRVHSEMFYVDVELPRGGKFSFSPDGREGALYVVAGSLRAADREVPANTMAILAGDVEVEASEDARFVVLGGTSLGKRYIDWNFVSSDLAAIRQAKADWANGPGSSARFPKVPGDDREFIPLPSNPPADYP